MSGAEPWIGSYRPFLVSFSEAELASGRVFYNYAEQAFPSTEAPGLSVFYLDRGTVYHTYSCYGRGLDGLNGAYQYLDLAPRGRDEAGLPWPMAWLKLKDQYPA